MGEQVLPKHLKRFAAFKAGSTIASEMLQEFRDDNSVERSLSAFLKEEGREVLRLILACEIIADSRGHDCGFHYWNVPVKRMLQDTGFVASSDLAALGLKQMQKLLSSETVEADWEPGLRQLSTRLERPPQTSNFEGLYLTKGQYKKISIGLKGDRDAFGIVRNIFSFYNPTFERALETTALDPAAVSEFSGSFPGEPTAEDTDCTKLLLHHFSTSLKWVRCDAHVYYASERTTTERSISFWDKLEPQLSKLSQLERFETKDLIFTEDLALRLLDLPHLAVFRVIAFSPGVVERLDFGGRLVAAALAKESLRVIAVPYLSDELVELVRAAPSRPMLQLKLRMVVERSEGRGKTEVDANSN